MPAPPRIGDPPKYTGFVCCACQRPVALIENKLPRTLVFHCPACGHWWSADAPGTPKH
jgi:DNA-directed RNA polymerase subunit RPC12/RpoP